MAKFVAPGPGQLRRSMEDEKLDLNPKSKRRSKSGGNDSSEDNMSKKDSALQQAMDQITSTFGKGSKIYHVAWSFCLAQKCTCGLNWFFRP